MEKNIEIEGMTMHYEETGPSDGEPVVLMHGWGCDHTTVRSIASVLDKRMRVLSVDLPGHGLSSEPNDVWGVEDFTSFVEKFISELNLGNPVLIGHSFGGRIAILLSSRRPIKKVVLIDAAGIKPKRGLGYYRKIYFFKAIKKSVRIIYGKEKGERIIDKWRSKKGSADYRNSSPVMRAVMSKCVNEDLKHVMPKIKASTLLMWGENDTATPLSDAKTMECLIPDAGLVAFPDCGHYCFLDNPIGFRAVIAEFIKKELNPKSYD